MAEQPQKRSDWSEAYVDNLPDSAFLYVEARGSKDATGKTMPRACRHFPYRDKDGAIDWPHLERAASRIPVSAVPGLTPAKKAALLEQANKLLEEGPEEEEGEKEDGFLSRCAVTLRETPPRKLALAGGLLIVILVALYFGIKKSGITGKGPKAPASVLAQKFTRIDTKPPYKIVELTFSEWQKLGPDSAGRYKDPETKEYTIVEPITCASCRKMIPVVQYPADVLALTGDARLDKQMQLRNEYKCPLCQKPAYPPEN